MGGVLIAGFERLSTPFSKGTDLDSWAPCAIGGKER